MRLISGTELKQRMDGGEDLKLVFVLGEWQYRTAHIPGSMNLPCAPGLYSSRDALQTLSPDDEIVVYCSNETCYASVSVYHLLQQRGYRNISRYAGGLVDWDGADWPLAGAMAPAQ